MRGEISLKTAKQRGMCELKLGSFVVPKSTRLLKKCTKITRLFAKSTTPQIYKVIPFKCDIFFGVVIEQNLEEMRTTA